MPKKTLALIIGLVAITIVLFIVALNTGKAHAGDNNHGWGVCKSTGPQCGTDNGTQSKTVYADPTFTCPEGYHYQNNGNFNERCHAIDNDTKPEHKAPTGATCPKGYTKSGSGEGTTCSEVITQSCHTGVIDTSACEVEPTATPTASPSAMPTPTPTPSANTEGGSSGGGQSNGAPAAVVCVNPFAAPVLTSITAGGSGELVVNWVDADTSINHYSLVYGLVGGAMNMGVDSIPNTSTSFTIGALPVGASINAQVWAWKDGCSEVSQTIDPIVR